MERGAFKLLSKMEQSWWYRGRAAALAAGVRSAHLAAVGDVLDFGAGFGGMKSALMSVATRVAAYEPDHEAARACEARGYDRVFSSDRDALARTWDRIALCDVLEHIEDDGAFLKRAHGALMASGVLLITVPAFPFLWSEHDVEHHHFRRYTRRSLRSVLEHSGFEVIYLSYWNMALFLPAALMRRAGKSGEGALSLPRSINALLYAFLRSEAALMRFVPLPFGTGMIAIARKARA